MYSIFLCPRLKVCMDNKGCPRIYVWQVIFMLLYIMVGFCFEYLFLFSIFYSHRNLQQAAFCRDIKSYTKTHVYTPYITKKPCHLQDNKMFLKLSSYKSKHTQGVFKIFVELQMYSWLLCGTKLSSEFVIKGNILQEQLYSTELKVFQQQRKSISKQHTSFTQTSTNIPQYLQIFKQHHHLQNQFHNHYHHYFLISVPTSPQL